MKILFKKNFFNCIGFLIFGYFSFLHLLNTRFNFFHDSTVAVQATIANNWLVTGKRFFLNGQEWMTHPPLTIILAMPGELFNMPILHRLIPFSMSLLTLFFWYKFIKLHYNNKELAIISVWFAAMSPIFIYFSPVLNYEQPLFFFLTLGLLSYENYIVNRKYKWLFGIALSFLGAGFTEWQIGVLSIVFLVDWQRGRCITLFPTIFSGIAMILSIVMINDFDIFANTVIARTAISFFSPFFWLIQTQCL